MMHDRSTNFVIAVLSQGKVLREVNGTVFLPFHSEYAIRAKNPTNHRVGVVVTIDGTEITNGKVIIDPNDSVDIKRMLVDGNLNNGPALKFVPLGDSKVQDPTSSENGFIKVDFYREIVPIPRYENNNGYYTYTGTDPNFIRRKGSSAVKDLRSQTRGITGQAVFGGVDANTLCSTKFVGAASQTTSQAGATVEGSNVNQGFREVSINLEFFPCATLILQMRGLTEPVFVKSKQKYHCTNCGSKIEVTDNFCGRCGARNTHSGTLYR